jgi:hypothetical protein
VAAIYVLSKDIVPRRVAESTNAASWFGKEKWAFRRQ